MKLVITEQNDALESKDTLMQNLVSQKNFINNISQKQRIQISDLESSKKPLHDKINNLKKELERNETSMREEKKSKDLQNLASEKMRLKVKSQEHEILSLRQELRQTGRIVEGMRNEFALMAKAINNEKELRDCVKLAYQKYVKDDRHSSKF